MTKIEYWKTTYQCAKPYPHIVIDNFLHQTRAERAAKVFPSLEDLPWYVYDNVFERKYAYDKVAEIPQPLSDLMWDLNSPTFLAVLEELTGISDLIADDSFCGGGLHCIANGGKLDVHADFNIHPVTKLHRRLNAILFLNQDWKPEFGGALELWEGDMTRCAEQILPLFNRLVIFTVTDIAFHGQPKPLQSPEGKLRKSMAWYYYTSERPESEKGSPHSTLYKRLPDELEDTAVEQLRDARAKGRLLDSQLESKIR